MKKLRLNKETLRNLNSEALSQAVGGKKTGTCNAGCVVTTTMVCPITVSCTLCDCFPDDPTG